MSEKLNPSHEDLQTAVIDAKQAVETSGSKTMHVQHKGAEMLGAFGSNVSWQEGNPSISSELRVGNTNYGNTHYEATATPLSGLEAASGVTKVQRRDAQGNVVYEHTSLDPRMARKVGIVAAHSIKGVAESFNKPVQSSPPESKAA